MGAGGETLAALRAQAASAYLSACALELAAIKPGNVHAAADGHGMKVADFMTSAAVSAGPLTEPGLGLGERVYRAVAATRSAVGCNTNLGICLLCGPLLCAVLEPTGSERLPERLAQVLAAADAEDMRWLNRAIRLAAPAGLGDADRYDVADEATASPLEVMALAADRDRIARQYVEEYRDLFERALPLLAEFQRRFRDAAWATAALYMDFLARYPDTHIARKFGMEQARTVSLRAAPLAAALARSTRPESLRGELLDLDRELKEAGINPGTSADLTVACLLIDRLQWLGVAPLSVADSPSDADAGAAGSSRHAPSVKPEEPRRISDG